MPGRGVVTSYTYNSRGQVDTISTAVPPNTDILNSGNVSYTYDNVGNPTAMTDKMGTLSFQYDELSRLTMESRHFYGVNTGVGELQQAPGGVGIFNISYDYDLGGSLKTVTDPYGQAVNYSQNKAGQTESITGSWFAGANHSYGSNVKYRAWGGVKSIDYINSTGTIQENYSYNNKLLPEKYSLTHLSNGAISVKKQYQYYADGLLKYTKDGDFNGTGTILDRSYKYDHIGRMTESMTGAEARGGSMPSIYEIYFLWYFRTRLFSI